MFRYTLQILQQMLQDFLSLSDHFGTFRKSSHYCDLCVRDFNHLKVPQQVFIQTLLSTAVFPQRFSFCYCLLSSVAPFGGPMIDTERKIFEI